MLAEESSATMLQDSFSFSFYAHGLQSLQRIFVKTREMKETSNDEEEDDNDDDSG